MLNVILLLFFFIAPVFYYRAIREKDWKNVKKELLPKYKGHKEEIIKSFKLFFLLIIGFLIVSFSISFVESVSGIGIVDMEPVEEYVLAGVRENIVVFLLLMTIVVFAEEFFFRAFLLKKIGVFLSTLIFTIFHAGYGSVTQLIGVFFLGLILAYWFKKNESLVQNYLGHLFYNFLAILLYVL